ncbi:ATP-binding protein [Microbacterium sp. NPDC096154]|uniref:ATP-binding protein n=1 Tax=Microbacterium sp. NPDC096154 TaxID=3155549 RepID=UPI00331DFF1E
MAEGALRLPRMSTGALGWKRRAAGFAVALTCGPLLSWLLYALAHEETLAANVLAYQLLVVIVALIGGIWPALFTAVLSGLTLNFLFLQPVFTITIASPTHALSVILYVASAVLVSWIVDQAARRARVAERAAAESELLATISGSVLRGESAAQALVTRAREAFHATGARLVGLDGALIAADGEPTWDGRSVSVPVGAAQTPRGTLELHGTRLGVSERRLLTVVATQLGAALEHAHLTEAAREADALAAADGVRAALLSAVSHDLRRPLAAAVAAVGGLRAAGVSLSDDDRAELIATADESLRTLSDLVADLLDVSRVQAGVLAVSLAALDAAEVVLASIDELRLGPDRVELAFAPDLPPVSADPVLLQRVVVNLLANADHHSPPGHPVRVETRAHGDAAQIRIVDRGPGVPADRQQEMFAPFQRMGDTDNTTGLGLGLALSRGFAEGMGGTLTPEDTPDGGLTMVVELPLARQQQQQQQSMREDGA